ncbi:MAG: DUF1476 family protein, partial [Hymenobacter sp.]
MDKFNEREQAYENKFIHDAEVEFRITARTNKYIGLWAAEMMFFNNNESKQYTENLVNHNIKQRNDINELINMFSFRK